MKSFLNSIEMEFSGISGRQTNPFSPTEEVADWLPYIGIAWQK